MINLVIKGGYPQCVLGIGELKNQFQQDASSLNVHLACHLNCL